MRAGDTIAACATPPGRSLRAMVRLSGPHTFAALRELGLSGWHDPSSRHAPSSVNHDGTARGRAVAPGVLSLGASELPVLLACYPGPHSYTGEDSAEIQFPGNLVLAQRVLDRVTSLENVRLAQPGEFTARTYLSGRLSLAQAEGVAATIAASTSEQLDAARELLEGRAGQRYAAWSEELATLLALVEAGIDFTDQEDVVAIEARVLSARLGSLREAIGSHLGSAAGMEAGGPLPRVVLVGEPNAGKSTLFNALLGRKRAVTSPVAGTTRDVLAEELDLSKEVAGAGSVLLQDVPGLEWEWAGATEKARSPVSVDELSQGAARDALEQADLLIWCDAKGSFEAGALRLPSKPTIRVRTFGDQPHAKATGEDLAVCALDGWNLSILRRAIADAATTARAGGIASLLPRHRRAMSQAYARLSEALDLTRGVEKLDQPEVVALTLRQGLDELGELVGQISPDEVLGRVFSTFCVGK